MLVLTTYYTLAISLWIWYGFDVTQEIKCSRQRSKRLVKRQQQSSFFVIDTIMVSSLVLTMLWYPHTGIRLALNNLRQSCSVIVVSTYRYKIWWWCMACYPNRNDCCRHKLQSISLLIFRCPAALLPIQQDAPRTSMLGWVARPFCLAPK
jgi:hypothetical protein